MPLDGFDLMLAMFVCAGLRFPQGACSGIFLAAIFAQGASDTARRGDNVRHPVRRERLAYPSHVLP
jgi:hypothetical protein